jgi:hypothetical protein
MNEPAVNLHADADRPALPPLGLTWGIKRSFVRYLSSLPDAQVSATDGAEIVEGSLFNFQPAGGSFDAAARTGVLRFRGDVRLSGHYGMMFVQLLDPWVEFTADGAVLTVGEPGVDTRYALATLQPAPDSPVDDEGGRLWEGVQAALSAAGSETFNDQYPAGQPMDPLFIRIPASA